MFSSETYDIEDCIRYDTSSYNVPTNSGITQISDFSFTNTGDWETEWVYKLPQTKCRIVLYNPSNTNIYLGQGIDGDRKHGIWWYGNSPTYSTASLNTEYTVRIVKENSVFKVYLDGNLLNTITYNDLLNTQTINIGERNWGTGTGTIKNIKIKSL
jgi:hypothetical protein